MTSDRERGLLDLLALIAEGITELVGFQVAVISVARDDGWLHRVAIAGSDEARAALAGTRTPIDALAAEVENADDWGLFKFVPHERTSGDFPFSWIPDLPASDEADAWHPLDLLLAPLLDAEGRLRGTLSIDVPTSGRRPDAAQRQMLEKYADQARRAVLTALEREQLAEQLRLAATARDIVRRASAELDVARLLEVTQRALADGFRAHSVRLEIFPQEGDDDRRVDAHDDGAPVSRALLDLAERQARAAWATQRAIPMSRDQVLEGLAGTVDRDALGDIGSYLFVPLGAGQKCLGSLTLTRPRGSSDWADVECLTAVDVGHDLGRAILNARVHEEERRLHAELRAVDAYKSQLIATVSHELKNPLTSVVGHLGLLEAIDVVRDAGSRHLAAARRGVDRMTQVIDSLLLLSKLHRADQVSSSEQIDLTCLAVDAVELTSVMADQRRQCINLELAGRPVHTRGEADELERVLVNLISNAIKYSPDGAGIDVAVSVEGEHAVVRVADHGIGISAEDQEELFSEFFRSSNPAAHDQPGTGLGLSIVQRIVHRHGGRIDVTSELGAGSTFRVELPLDPAG